uniref:uncharacterized protein si:dkey-220o5.5 isoform X3 n=1 Tax=Doryrhamphus excisus TaxID=161450 RepID=UPI0025AE93E6|nr:uncharacterized protein si:dkey-220o5.5 isoform X3 [Doryrhamphus excisus]
MDKQKALAKLMWDLQSFLSVLDSENLSYMAQAQKKSISELVSALQTSDAAAEDAEYVVMSCPSSSPGNQALAPPTGGLSESSSRPDSNVWMRDAVTTAMLRPPGAPKATDDDDEDEDTYEEAQPYSRDAPAEGAESDSSCYESYGEEDEDGEHVKDRAHYIQWSASQPCLRPAPESRLCGYLWRRRWLGQWTKQLFIIRNHSLMCYKCARDLLPQMEVDLRGCQLVYKRKSNRRVQHQLKLLLLDSQTMVLGYTSSQQASEWLQVIEELSVGTEEQNLSGPAPEPQWSCRSSVVLTHNDQQEAPSPNNKDTGFLNVLMNCQWQSLLCRVEAGLLNMFGQDQGAGPQRGRRPPQYTLQLRGCKVQAGPDGERSHRITLSTLGDQVAVLEVSSADEKRRWMRLLKEGAAGYHGNKTQQQAGAALSGLQANMYMDDPAHQPVYSNTSPLDHMLHSSLDAPVTYTNLSRHSELAGSAHLAANSGRPNKVCAATDRKWAETQRGIQKLELAARKGVPMRAGSEVNLPSALKQNKRSSFRQSLAVCGERAQVIDTCFGDDVINFIFSDARFWSSLVTYWFYWSLLFSSGLYWSPTGSTGLCCSLPVPIHPCWSVPISSGLYWSPTGSTGLCCSLLVFTGHLLVLLVFAVLFWSLLVTYWFYWSLLFSSDLYWSPTGSTGLCCSLPVPTHPCWSVPISSGLYWSPTGSTGPRCALLVFTGLCCSLLVSGGTCWSILVPANFSWSLRVFTGHLLVLLVPDCFYCFLLVFAGSFWSLLLISLGLCWSLLVTYWFFWSLVVPAGLYWSLLLVPSGHYLAPIHLFLFLSVSAAPCRSTLVPAGGD